MNFLLVIAISFRIMFYNCENLLHSNGHVYDKLTNLTRVIVAAGKGEPPAIIGLAEVENDSIMTRWVRYTPLSKWQYRYVITHSPDKRGINVALMYRTHEFRLLGSNEHLVAMPKGVKSTRNILHAWGRVVSGDTLDVLVCHFPSRYGGKKASDKSRAVAHAKAVQIMDSLQQCRQNPNIVLMGDMNDYPTSKAVIKDFDRYVNLMYPLQLELRKGSLEYGSHKYAGEWGFLDQFIVNEALTDSVYNNIFVRDAKAFALPFMLTYDEKNLGLRPKRSRYGYKYEGGFSDHLPIVMVLRL